MEFLDLIDAYALAERRHYAAQNSPGTSNGPYGPETQESVQAAGRAIELHAEIERRLGRISNERYDPSCLPMDLLDEEEGQ